METVGPVHASVLMPTTVRLTRLILLSLAFDCPCDGVVMAAALSMNDVSDLSLRPDDGRVHLRAFLELAQRDPN